MHKTTKIVLLIAVVYFAAYLCLPLGYDAQFYVSSSYEDYIARVAELNPLAPLASEEYYINYPVAMRRLAFTAYSWFGEFGFKALSVIVCLLMPFLALKSISRQAGFVFGALSGLPMLFLAYSTLAQALVTVLLINFYSRYAKLETIKWRVVCLGAYLFFASRVHSFGIYLILLMFGLIELNKLITWSKSMRLPALLIDLGLIKTLCIVALQFALIPIYSAFAGKKHKIVSAFLLVSLVACLYDVRTVWSGYVLACVNAPASILKWRWLPVFVLLNVAVQLWFYFLIS